MIEKIYRVYEGAVASTKVLKETECYVYVEPTGFSQYRQRLDKTHVCTTPEEAVQEELNKAQSMYGACKDRFISATARLEKAKELKEKYPHKF